MRRMTKGRSPKHSHQNQPQSFLLPVLLALYHKLATEPVPAHEIGDVGSKAFCFSINNGNGLAVVTFRPGVGGISENFGETEVVGETLDCNTWI